MSLLNEEIGGYFELELPQRFSEKYPSAIKYQSARSAFMALLQQMPNVNRVWMPHFICDTMLAPVRAANKELAPYSINNQFAIAHPITLAKNDLLLYVNYFGVCEKNVLDVLSRYPIEQVIIDCSQAFFSGPFNCLATLYSPRKFFGVPDGGLLITNKKLKLPTQQDEGSISRFDHLLRRLAHSAEAGYKSFKEAEASLKELTPKRMSQLTERILSSIDYDAIEKKRTTNFKKIASAFNPINMLKVDAQFSAPMCYPFLPEKTIEKTNLIAKKIFIPTYWPEVEDRVKTNAFELTIIKKMLAIPCDQRYDEKTLSQLSHRIN